MSKKTKAIIELCNMDEMPAMNIKIDGTCGGLYIRKFLEEKLDDAICELMEAAESRREYIEQTTQADIESIKARTGKE